MANLLLERMPKLRKLVTCTTRPRRKGEIPDKDYHFLSQEEFEEMIENDELFEWAKVYDRYYGNRTMDVERILQQGLDVLMVIDIQGARTVKQKWPGAIAIFLKPQSEAELRSRILERGSVADEELERRLQAVRQESAFADDADYVLTNPQGKLKEIVDKIESLLTK